jgi:hypothetical protein
MRTSLATEYNINSVLLGLNGCCSHFKERLMAFLSSVNFPLPGTEIKPEHAAGLHQATLAVMRSTAL